MAQVGETRRPVQAGDLVRIDGALAESIGAAGEGDFLFRTGLAFQARPTSTGRAGRSSTRRCATCAARSRRCPPAATGSCWSRLHPVRAADATGVLIDAWELALLRVGTTTEYLVRHGISSERVAVRFHAGVAPSEQQQVEPQRVELKLLCCLG